MSYILSLSALYMVETCVFIESCIYLSVNMLIYLLFYCWNKWCL